MNQLPEGGALCIVGVKKMGYLFAHAVERDVGSAESQQCGTVGPEKVLNGARASLVQPEMKNQAFHGCATEC